jgi:hypothetical protein
MEKHRKLPKMSDKPRKEEGAGRVGEVLRRELGASEKIPRMVHFSDSVVSFVPKGIVMRSLFKYFAPLLLVVAITSPVVMTGCHSQETVYYNQWERDTHREHKDLNKRNEAEQREYSDWRRSRDHH